jgi:hypothetical protein
MEPTRTSRPATISGSSITPTWAMTRPFSRRTNGVETAAHEKPSAAARAARPGRLGHTRPRSAASAGSSAGVADDTPAL